MFTHDYTIYGSHATKLKFLAKQDNKPYYFRRYIDVYMNAVVFGLLYNQKAVRDDKNDRARIYADAFSKESDKCELLFKLVMLLDETSNLSTDERLNRAFRDASSGNTEKIKQNMDLFNQYVLGGIDILYEKLTNGCVSQDDYNKRIIDLMENFEAEFTGNDIKDKINKLLTEDD